MPLVDVVNLFLAQIPLGWSLVAGVMATSRFYSWGGNAPK
jgi:hypothetical protein